MEVTGDWVWEMVVYCARAGECGEVRLVPLSFRVRRQGARKALRKKGKGSVQEVYAVLGLRGEAFYWGGVVADKREWRLPAPLFFR